MAEDGRCGIDYWALLIMAAYWLANVILWIATVPDGRFLFGSDSMTWIRPALALLEHGAFVQLHDPSLPDVYRPPGYPLFAAAVMGLAGSTHPDIMSLAHIGLTAISGLLFRDLVRGVLPGWHNLGLAIFLFNPSIFVSAHLIQSEPLTLFLMTLVLWAMLRYSRRGYSWPMALLAGAAISAASLSRPTVQFLVLAVPIAPIVLVMLGRRLDLWRRAVLQGVAAFALALAMLAPWLAYTTAAGEGPTLSGAEGYHRHIWDQVITIEAMITGGSHYDIGQRFHGEGGIEDLYIDSLGTEWDGLSEPEQHRKLARLGIERILSYPLAALLKGFAISTAHYHLGGGSGNYHNLLGLTGESSITHIWGTTDQSNPLNFVTRYFGTLSPAQLLVSALCLGFAFVSRVLGLISLIAMRRDWQVVAIVVALLTYLTTVHLFLGTTRFRMPAEPMLMLITVYGVTECRALWSRMRNGHKALAHPLRE